VLDRELDPRLLRVIIDLGGKPKVYEKLAISVKGTKNTSSIANVCEIRIANIDKPDREKLLTEGTPYSILDRLKNSVRIDAGRESAGMHQVYVGDITRVNVTQAPDIWLVMRSITGKFLKDTTIELSQNKVAKYSTIVDNLADVMGLIPVFLAPDRDISNFSVSGSIMDLMHALGEVSLGVDAYVDDVGGRLVIKPRALPDGDDILEVNIDTGLIGIPEFLNLGVRCTVLLTHQIRLGQQIHLTSEAYPATDGFYVIYRLGFDLATRDTPFYYTLTAHNPDLARRRAA